MCHLLYGKIRDVYKVFSIVKDAKDVKTVLYEEIKSSLNYLSDSKRRNMENKGYVQKNMINFSLGTCLMIVLILCLRQ